MGSLLCAVVCTLHSTVLYVSRRSACTATVLCLSNASWDGVLFLAGSPSSVAPSPDAADATGRHTFLAVL